MSKTIRTPAVDYLFDAILSLKDREEWISYFVKQSKNYGMTCCLWDNQLYEPSTTKTERYGYYDRENAQWYFPSIIKAAVKASKN